MAKYKKKLDDDIRCPLEYGLAIFGGNWKSRIISVLSAAEKLRYSELRREMCNITDAVLAATGDSQNAKLIFRCPDGGEILFGFTSLMPGTTYNGHGLRVDLVEKLRDLHPSFMRFPGGCIVEGRRRPLSCYFVIQ